MTPSQLTRLPYPDNANITFVFRMIGFLMLILSTSDHIKYGGCFFVTCGLFPSVPQGIVWASCNIGGSLKRAVGIAMFVMFANIAALTSAFTYLPKWGPTYRNGHIVLLSTTAFSCALAVFMTTWLGKENRRRDAVKNWEAYTDEEKIAQRELGD
jgi:hypothetical protein